MYVSHLSLHDFRNHEQVDLKFAPGPTAFVGRNGQGKTNLIEALGYVATLSSHRVAVDAPLIRKGAERAVIRTRVVREDRASTVELEITAGKANRARINRGQLGSPREVLGILRTVLFAPEDLAMVKGDPDGRRRFLDQLAVQLLPRTASLLSEYERVIRQRSALLKSLRTAGRGADLSTLEVWDAKAAALGGQILQMRLQLVQALSPQLLSAYEQVSDANGAAEITYKSSLDVMNGAMDDAFAGMPRGQATGGQTAAGASSVPPAEDLTAALLAAMNEARSREIERGVSLIGPHRDDLLLTLAGLPAKGYASHGESWSFALALRLASYRLLGGGDDGNGDGDRRSDGREDGNEIPAVTTNADDLFWNPNYEADADPVLILDDVFAELDVRRRQRLAELVSTARQVLVTAAVPDDVPKDLLAVKFDVSAGQVKRAN